MHNARQCPPGAIIPGVEGCHADGPGCNRLHLLMRPAHGAGGHGTHDLSSAKCAIAGRWCGSSTHLSFRCADVTDGSTVHLVMRPVDTSAPPPAASEADRAHPFAGPMGGGFPIAFRGGPSGALNPNDFGQVGPPSRSLYMLNQSMQAHITARAAYACTMCMLSGRMLVGVWETCRIHTPGVMAKPVLAMGSRSVVMALRRPALLWKWCERLLPVRSSLRACWAAWASRALCRSCTPPSPWSGRQTWVSCAPKNCVVMQTPFLQAKEGQRHVTSLSDLTAAIGSADTQQQ